MFSYCTDNIFLLHRSCSIVFLLYILFFNVFLLYRLCKLTVPTDRMRAKTLRQIKICCSMAAFCIHRVCLYLTPVLNSEISESEFQNLQTEKKICLLIRLYLSNLANCQELGRFTIMYCKLY